MQVTISINGEAVSRTSSRGSCSSTSSARRSASPARTWAATRRAAAPARCCSTARRSSRAPCSPAGGRATRSTTVEGARPDGVLHAIQEGFHEEHGAAVRVLHARDDAHRPGAARREPEPQRARDPLGDLREICRCTGLPEHRQPRPVGGRARSRDAKGGMRMATVENLRARAGAAARLRAPQAQGGRALHPRQGQLHRRHHAARDAAHRDPAQPVRARAHQLDRHLGALRIPASSRSSPASSRGAQSRLDADPFGRHAGRARRRDKVRFQGQEVASVIADDATSRTTRSS